MGFFKKLGKSLKGVTKAISLKNGLKLASGDYRGVIQEVQGRVVGGLKEFGQGEIDKIKIKTGGVKSPPKLSKNDLAIQDLLVTQANQHLEPIRQNATQQLAESKTGQQLSDFLTKQYLLTMWTKYKTYIIIGGIAVVVFIFRGKIFGTKSKR